MYQSVETWPSHPYTLDDGVVAGQGGPHTRSYYPGSVPPSECGDGCEIHGWGVRILFWPVDDNNTHVHNVSVAAAKLPYTTVSDGFTL